MLYISQKGLHWSTNAHDKYLIEILECITVRALKLEDTKRRICSFMEYSLSFKRANNMHESI